MLKPVYEGLLFIRGQSRIRQSLYLLTFSQALIATLVVLAPGFADKILLIEIERVSLVVMGPAAAGLILGAFLVGFKPKKILRGSLILAGILLTGITLISLSIISLINFRGMIYPVMLLLIILGMSNSFISIPSSTIIQEETEERLRGRVYGVLTSLTGGVSILPVLFSGILADVIGTAKTLLIIGSAVIVTGVYYLNNR